MLLGVDALIDPVRTSVNVVSHCISPAAIASWEGVKFRHDLEPVADGESNSG